MEMKKQQGFSAVEALLFIIAVGLITGVGWYIWQQRPENSQMLTDTQQKTEKPEPKSYERSTTVPEDWKLYSNKDYGFSISYPDAWEIKEVDIDDSFALDFWPAGSQAPQYRLQTSQEGIENKVAAQKKIYTDSQSSDDYDGDIIFNITNEERFTYDSNPAMRIDVTGDDGTQPDSYFTTFYVQANDYLYIFDTGTQDKKLTNELLTVFESLKFN